MINKIIVSGCSYSAYTGETPYPELLKNKYGYDVYNMAWCGQSNDSILKKVYDYIQNTNIKKSLIICQLTYTHRIGWHHSFVNRWIDYQPKYIQTIPNYDVESDSVIFNISTDDAYMEGGNHIFPNDINEDDYNKLTEMYKNWLEYVYDETEMFNNTLYKVDTLKSYVESSDNKILFIYWPNIENKKQLFEIQKREFFNIDNDYSMLKWSTKNKLIDNTSHLSKKGHLKMAEYIDDYMKINYYNINKNLL